MAVQKMQDYIRAHLTEKIGLAELAQQAQFSPWYCYRLFQAHTGLTPARYIRRLRLAEAALQLKNESGRVIDAAFDLGFGTVDGFTRAFTKEFGLCPSSYAANPVPIALFVPYGAKFRALRKDHVSMENTHHIFLQIIQKPARKVVCKRGVKAESYFAYCEEVGCEIWGMLLSMDSLCGEPVCLWLPEQYKKPNTSAYVQGVEVPLSYTGPVPEGFDTITLPAASYLMFQGEPFAEEEYSRAILSLQQAMDRYDPSAIGYRWDDENPRIQLEPRGNRGYIEMRAVKQR